MDVNLLGTTAGVDLSRIAIAAMTGNSYQIGARVNGNANTRLTYTMSPPAPEASVSHSGVVKLLPCLQWRKLWLACAARLKELPTNALTSRFTSSCLGR